MQTYLSVNHWFFRLVSRSMRFWHLFDICVRKRHQSPYESLKLTHFSTKLFSGKRGGETTENTPIRQKRKRNHFYKSSAVVQKACCECKSSDSRTAVDSELLTCPTATDSSALLYPVAVCWERLVAVGKAECNRIWCPFPFEAEPPDVRDNFSVLKIKRPESLVSVTLSVTSWRRLTSVLACYKFCYQPSSVSIFWRASLNFAWSSCLQIEVRCPASRAAKEHC